MTTRVTVMVGAEAGMEAEVVVVAVVAEEGKVAGRAVEGEILERGMGLKTK